MRKGKKKTKNIKAKTISQKIKEEERRKKILKNLLIKKQFIHKISHLKKKIKKR